MALRRMYDAAYPPAHPPAWEAVAGYIGGNTPHVWSAAEWRSQPARYRLGIWTRSNPAGYSGAAEGVAAAVKWRSLGAPKGTTIALDYEQAVDGVYVTEFNAAVVAAGYRCLLYGAQSYVLRNPRPSAGYWIANWNTPHTPYLDPRSSATQYAGDVQLGVPYDASLVADSLPLWDTHPAPAPSPSPTPQQEDDMPQWLNGTITPGPNSTVALVPHGNAWSAYPNRTLHLGMDDVGTMPDGSPLPASATVRVAVHNGAGWSGTGTAAAPVTHAVTAAGGTVDVPLPADAERVSLAIVNGGPVSYGIEVW